MKTYRGHTHSATKKGNKKQKNKHTKNIIFSSSIELPMRYINFDGAIQLKTIGIPV